MRYINILLRDQFPQYKGFNDVEDYKFCGIPYVEPKSDFIQIAHSGGVHWALISNRYIPVDDRHYRVNLYDSLIQFSYQS